jgi:hypothetical protein
MFLFVVDALISLLQMNIIAICSAPCILCTLSLISLPSKHPCGPNSQFLFKLVAPVSICNSAKLSPVFNLPSVPNFMPNRTTTTNSAVIVLRPELSDYRPELAEL